MAELSPRRVAIISIHGVADQKPGDSASAIASMLLTVTRDSGDPAYSTFRAHELHIPMAPAVAQGIEADLRSAATKAGLTPPAGPVGRFRAQFQEADIRYRAILSEASPEKSPPPDQSTKVDRSSGDDSVDAGLTYMRLLLGQYDGHEGGGSYITTRLEGRRKPSTDATDSTGDEVDIYEMHWADLSTLGRDPLRFFGSLYQLVLHLSELGRRALEDGMREFGKDKRWARLVGLHSLAVRQLAVTIPVMNLILLLAMVGAVIVRVAGGSTTVPGIDVTRNVGVKGASVVFAVLICIAVGYWIAKPPHRWRLRGWWMVPTLAGLAGAVIGVVMLKVFRRADLVLAVEWWIVACGLLVFILNKYEQVRPGALSLGRWLYGVCSLLFLFALVVAFRDHSSNSRAVEYATLWTMQMVFLLLTAFWALLILASIGSAVYGHVIVTSLAGWAHARARSAVRTSRLAIGISASAMIGILVIFWSGLLAWGMTSLNVFNCMEARPFPPIKSWRLLIPSPEVITNWLGKWPDSPICSPVVEHSVHGYFTAILLMTTTSGLPVSLLLVGLALVLLTWMAGPSALLEGEAPSTCSNADSNQAGTWLSHGLDATRVVTHLFWGSVFLVLPVFLAGDFATQQGWAVPPPLDSLFLLSRRLALPILQTGGSIIAASAALIVFGLAKVGGSALDVVLDVDNYLRELPSKSPPRARIAERYASLLRFVAADQSNEGRKYDSVVIIAHSLGALITVDLLRYLVSESAVNRGDPLLAPFGMGQAPTPPEIPIHVFTMGNPLRQLLNRFFPHQYYWVRPKPDNSVKPASRKVARSTIGKSVSPFDSAIGVASWTNAYRSGDYVGRALWLNEWYNRTVNSDPAGGAYPEPIHIATRNGESEMCIGLGAHTHYWDSTAPDIRDHLDRLVTSAPAGD